jgi:hypothetical protein
MNLSQKPMSAVVGISLALFVAIGAEPVGAADQQIMHSSHKSPGPGKPAHVGAVISIAGAVASKADVKLIKVIDPAQVTSHFLSVPPGNRFVGTEFRIVSTGSSPFASADSALSVTVTGSNNRVYKSTASTAYTSNTTGCINLDNEIDALPKGKSVTGCVNFTVPTGVTVTKVVYHAAGGTTGQWDVP